MRTRTRQQERVWYPLPERDWRGREGPLSGYFGFEVGEWAGEWAGGCAPGREEQRRVRLMDFLARLRRDDGANPLLEHALDLRMVVWPGGARERARDRVQWWLLGRVSLYEATPETLERAALAFQAEISSLLDQFLPEQVFRELSGMREIRAALAPFPVGDMVELRRGREMWCAGEAPAALRGTLDGDRLAEELLRQEGASLLSVRVQPVGVSDEGIQAAARQVYDCAGGWESPLLGSHMRHGSDLVALEEQLTRIDLARRLYDRWGGAFKLCIQLVSAGGVRRSARRMLEREAGEPRYTGLADGKSKDAESDMPSGCECVAPRTCWARGAREARVSEFALAVRNLERLELTRWDDLAGTRLEDGVWALAELADAGEVARLWPLPAGLAARV